jgi:hypothetical protein
MTTSGTVLSFFRSKHWSANDWTQQELAEFYRVEAALTRGGLLVEVDRGLSDEGDPWFVFCRRDNGEVIAHFARVRGQYIVASSAVSGVARGQNFGLLLSELMRAHPMAFLRDIHRSQNVFLHPAAMLVALLATAFAMSSDEAVDHGHASDPLGKEVIRLFQLSDFAILSAVAIATTWIDDQINAGLKFLETDHEAAHIDRGAASGTHASANLVPILDSMSFETNKVVDQSSLAAAGSGQGDLARPDQPTVPMAKQTLPLKFMDITRDATVLATHSEASSHSTGSSVTSVDTVSSPQAVLGEQTSITAPQPIIPNDHGSVPIAQTAAVSNDQLVVAGSVTVTSTNAYQVLASDFGAIKVPVFISTGNFTLDDSIQAAAAHVGYVQNVTELKDATNLHPTTTESPASSSPLSSLPAVSQSGPPMFNAQANDTLQAFELLTPNLEADFVGRHAILIDKNPSDAASVHFGSESWAFSDGSTLTIVGILPIAVHTGVHMTG